MKRPTRFQIDTGLLVLANTLWPFGYSMYIGFFPLHVAHLGGSKLVISILASIPFFAGLLAVIGGYLADRMDRKTLLVIGWAVTVPAPLIWAFADHWTWLLAGQLLYSLTAVCIPAMTLYVFDHAMPGNRLTAYSMVNVGGIAGSIMAPSIGAAVIAVYGIKTLFLLVFVVYGVATFSMLFMSKQIPVKTGEKSGKDNLRNTLNELKTKGTLTIMFFLSCLLFIMNMAEPYLSVYLSDALAMPVKNIGNAFTSLFVGASIITWLFGKKTEKSNPHHIIILGIALFWTGIAALLLSSYPIFIYGGFFLRGVNRALLFFVQGVFVYNLDTHNKGLVLSIFISLRNIFIGFAAYPGAFLYSLNPAAPFLAEGTLLLLWILFSYGKGFAPFRKKVS